MVTHFNILAWEIPQTEEPGRLQSMGSQKESDMTEQLKHACTLDLYYSLSIFALCELVLSTLKSFETISIWSPQSS